MLTSSVIQAEKKQLCDALASAQDRADQMALEMETVQQQLKMSQEQLNQMLHENNTQAETADCVVMSDDTAAADDDAMLIQQDHSNSVNEITLVVPPIDVASIGHVVDDEHQSVETPTTNPVQEQSNWLHNDISLCMNASHTN